MELNYESIDWEQGTTHRELVKRWSIKLLRMARSVRDRSPIRALAKLNALDEAMARCAIFGLCAVDHDRARQLIEAIFCEATDAQETSLRIEHEEPFAQKSLPDSGGTHE